MYLYNKDFIIDVYALLRKVTYHHFEISGIYV